MVKVGELIVVARAHVSDGRHVGEYGLWRQSAYGGAYRPTLVQKITPRDTQDEALSVAMDAGIKRAMSVQGDMSLKAQPASEAARLQIEAFFAYSAKPETTAA